MCGDYLMSPTHNTVKLEKFTLPEYRSTKLTQDDQSAVLPGAGSYANHSRCAEFPFLGLLLMQLPNMATSSALLFDGALV